MGLTLLGRQSPLSTSEVQLRLLAETPGCPPFEERLRTIKLDPLHATGITVFQINVGKLCNQTCRHCHVDAGPDRRETMSRGTAELCMQALAKTDIPTVDITGGAPELNPNFRWLVSEARALGKHVIDRCNLSVLLLPSQESLGKFLADHHIEVIASLPYFRRSQTDAEVRASLRSPSRRCGS
jgi:radical SAM/Cys-rich protein